MKKFILGIVSLTALSLNVNSQSCLMADYTFTGNANDNSGNGHHATLYGATLTTDRFGNLNSAYEFDGVNDYINTFTTFDYQYRTVSYWFKADNVAGIGSNDHHILTHDDGSLTYGSFVSQIAGGVFGSTAGGNQSAMYFDSTIATNQWYHFVMVRDGSVNKYYVNGQLAGTAASNSGGSTAYPYNKLVIGTSRTRNDGFFDGVIDDIQIYNCALPDSSIQALYSPNPPCTVTVYDTVDVFDTTMVTVYDTTQVTILDTTDVFDTTNVTLYDTVITNIYDTTTIQDTVTITDTSFITVYDTAIVTVYDTAIVYDTIWVTDTVYLEVSEKVAGNPNQLIVYPNPTDDLIYFESSDQTSLIDFEVLIINTAGQVVYSSTINQSRFSVNLSSLGSRGAYLVRLVSPDKEIIQERKVILR